MQRFALRCSIHFAEANAARMQCCADKTLQKERERERERDREKEKRGGVRKELDTGVSGLLE